MRAIFLRVISLQAISLHKPFARMAASYSKVISGDYCVLAISTPRQNRSSHSDEGRSAIKSTISSSKR